MMAVAHPFVKWAGGKSQLLEEIRATYPSRIEKYCEPFVGGGAVLFDVLQKAHPEQILINDINAELINTYTQIRDNCENLIELLSELQTSYREKSETERKLLFYEKRNRYNELKIGGNEAENVGKHRLGHVEVSEATETSTDASAGRRTCYASAFSMTDITIPLEKAALFIFLNKTCFNGLYRVNSKGLFNVPFNSAKNPPICDAENLRACSELLQNVEMRAGDYSACRDFIGANTFVYIDPPYRPLNATQAFTSYNENGFGDKEQIELEHFIEEISVKGAKVLASNSDPKNVDESDNFLKSK